MKESAIAFIVSMLLLTACSKDNDETVTVETPTGVATVTYLVTPNGLGDNSYNDAAAEGIFAFAHVTGTRLRMLQPKDEAEAGTPPRILLCSSLAVLPTKPLPVRHRRPSRTDCNP